MLHKLSNFRQCTHETKPLLCLRVEITEENQNNGALMKRNVGRTMKRQTD